MCFSDQSIIMMNENTICYENNLNKGLISYRYDRLLVKQETINHLVHKKMKDNSTTSIIC